MPEAGGDAALYANPNNPAEIASQLNRIISDPQLRQQMVLDGRIQREKFSMKKIVDEFYSLYRYLHPATNDDF